MANCLPYGKVFSMEDETEEQRIFNQFVGTFPDIPKYDNELLTDTQKKELKRALENRKLAEDVVNYILRQLNSSSLRGVLHYEDYRTLVINASKGLFKLLYLENYSDDDVDDLTRRDVIFASAFNFIFMLFTRVYEGKDYDYYIKELESRRPVNIVGGK